MAVSLGETSFKKIDKSQEKIHVVHMLSLAPSPLSARPLRSPALPVSPAASSSVVVCDLLYFSLH